MRALSEKRLSDYMAQQIADEILSGRIVGGTQLKQEELAEVFGAELEWDGITKTVTLMKN